MPISMFLPVLTYPYPTSLQGLQRAVDLAASIGADLHAHVVQIDIPPVSNPPISFGLDVVAMASNAEAFSRSNVEKASSYLQLETHRLNIKLGLESITSRVEFVSEAMAVASRTHDFSLFSMGTSTEERDVAKWLIFDSGRPAILMPPSSEAPNSLSTIAVAWDGSRASARALFDALPLLGKAERVVVLTADRDKEIDARSIDGVLAVLQRQGIAYSHSDVLILSDKAIGDALQDAALRKGAGLLVMGGYGHSRFREFILGGATRTVLANLHLPILMSH